jgi:hypothetical protein
MPKAKFSIFWVRKILAFGFFALSISTQVNATSIDQPQTDELGREVDAHSFLREYTSLLGPAKELSCQFKRNNWEGKNSSQVFLQFGLTLLIQSQAYCGHGRSQVACNWFRTEDKSGNIFDFYTVPGLGAAELRANGHSLLGVHLDEKQGSCELVSLVKFNYDKDTGLASGSSFFDVKKKSVTTSYDDLPKSIENIYKCETETGRSFEEIQKIASDASRISVAILEYGFDYNRREYAYKIDRTKLNSKFIQGERSDVLHGTMVTKALAENNDQVKLVLFSRTANSTIDANVQMYNQLKMLKSEGIKVANLSFGGVSFPADAFNTLCRTIIENPQILFVASAMNDHKDLDTVSNAFPQGCKAQNLLNVAALDKNGNLASYSNYGAKTVQIAASGDIELDGTYDDGTSFAAPRVSSVAGKVLHINPKLSPIEVISILKASATSVPALSGYLSWSSVLNEDRALMLAKDSIK